MFYIPTCSIKTQLSIVQPINPWPMKKLAEQITLCRIVFRAKDNWSSGRRRKEWGGEGRGERVLHSSAVLRSCLYFNPGKEQMWFRLSQVQTLTAASFHLLAPPPASSRLLSMLRHPPFPHPATSPLTLQFNTKSNPVSFMPLLPLSLLCILIQQNIINKYKTMNI